MHQDQIHAEDSAIHPPRSRTANCDCEPEAGFITRNQERVFYTIYRIVRNREDARDITQDTLFRAVRKKDQVKDEKLFDHWLTRIAKNAAIDFLRRSKAYLNRDMATLGNLVERSGDAEGRLISKERVEHLRGLLAILSERERRALTLRDLDGLPSSDVAICMGCSSATVRSHIKCAMDKLRRHPGLHNNLYQTRDHQTPNTL